MIDRGWAGALTDLEGSARRPSPEKAGRMGLGDRGLSCGFGGAKIGAVPTSPNKGRAGFGAVVAEVTFVNNPPVGVVSGLRSPLLNELSGDVCICSPSSSSSS